MLEKKNKKTSMFQCLIIRPHFQLQILKSPVVWRVFTKLKKKESKIITFGRTNVGEIPFFFSLRIAVKQIFCEFKKKQTEKWSKKYIYLKT